MVVCRRRFFAFVSMEEVRVSDVEVCNLAYRGQLEQLKSLVLADKSLTSRTDQVRVELLVPVPRAMCTAKFCYL